MWNVACSPFVCAENLPVCRGYFFLCMQRHCVLCLLRGQAAVHWWAPEARRTVALANFGDKSVCARHTHGTYCGSCLVSSVYQYREARPTLSGAQAACDQTRLEAESATTLQQVFGDTRRKFGLNDRDKPLFSNVEAVCGQCRQDVISSKTPPTISKVCREQPFYSRSVGMATMDETQSILDAWADAWEGDWIITKYKEMLERGFVPVSNKIPKLEILSYTQSQLIFAGAWDHPHDILKPDNLASPLFMQDRPQKPGFPLEILPPLTWATYTDELPTAYYHAMRHIFSPLFAKLRLHRHLSLEKALHILRAQRAWYLAHGLQEEARLIPDIPSRVPEPTSLTCRTLNWVSPVNSSPLRRDL